jgi:hypothetical protein
MSKLPLILTAGAVLALGAAAALATGAPKPEHPCYEVADCKTQGSRQAFSKCVKANVDQANAIPACAEFRKDKPAYMDKHGIDGVDALFEG